jgi:hypothetical protein
MVAPPCRGVTRAGMIGLCLGPAASGLVTAFISTASFTLSWEHTVERVLWEEDYRIEDGALMPAAARIKGSGAGMEPPAGAVLRDGAWHYRPDLPPLPELRLALSPVGDYTLCWAGRCWPLSSLVAVPDGAAVVLLRPCDSAP